MVVKFLDPKNDIVFKKLFGTEKNKEILIHFINDIMEYKEEEKIQDLSFLNTAQDPEIAYKKQSLVDVLCRTKNGTQIIVEMQVSPCKGFEKWAQYYAAKAYARQLSQGQKESGLYSNLKEIIFIAISDYTVFPDKREYISHHIILDKLTYDHHLKDFSFTFIELPKFHINKTEDLKTIVEKWLFFFKYADTTSEGELKKMIGKDLIVGRAYDALRQFNFNDTELLAYEQEIKRKMDNLAVESYMIESAEARGEARGKTKEKMKIARKLKKSGVSLSVISESTGLSEKEIEELN